MADKKVFKKRKKRATPKADKMNALERDLMALIDPNNAVELEKVTRYLNLVDIFDKLDRTIREKGVMIKTINASQEFYKTNPAISEKVKINAALIKLDLFFDRKREEYMTKQAKSDNVDVDDFV